MWRAGARLSAPNLFVVSVESGELIRVTRDGAHGAVAASWSPDGRWIAFESYAFDEDESAASLWQIAAPALPDGEP